MRIISNHALTILYNTINNKNLTNAYTCYKMFRSNIFLTMQLKENGFFAQKLIQN